MRRWLRPAAWAAAAAAAASLIWFAWLRDRPVPVRVFAAQLGAVEEIVTNSKAGTVKARRRSRISPEIGGRVAYIGARPGSRVRKGEVLLRLNDEDLRASLRLAEREVVTARSRATEACLNAELAERDLKRNLDLQDRRIVSPELLDRLESERDAARARCEAARAAVDSARAAVSLARANLNKTVLRAPFDGVVAELDAEIGEWVSPSPPAVPIPPAYDIIDPTSIYISAPLDEVDAGRVAPDLPARVTLDPYPGESFEGRVTRVAPYVRDIEEQNRTLEVEVDFADREIARRLLPGTSADVEIILRKAEGVLRIPAYALLEGERVLVYNGGRLEGRTVVTGLRNWEFVEIREGLRPGERVVVSLDRAEVREGARAVVQDGDGHPRR
ncbi:MAG: efflux RND transporter periplasmic adaptor subunit [Acidobacteriota bacterium]